MSEDIASKLLRINKIKQEYQHLFKEGGFLNSEILSTFNVDLSCALCHPSKTNESIDEKWNGNILRVIKDGRLIRFRESQSELSDSNKQYFNASEDIVYIDKYHELINKTISVEFLNDMTLSNLLSVNLENVTEINTNRRFGYVKNNITDINLSNCQKIYSIMNDYGLYNLTGINLENIEEIHGSQNGAGFFAGAEKIKDLYCPKLSVIGNGGLRWMNSLSNLYAPNLVSVGKTGLYFNDITRDQYFPRLSSIGYEGFKNCKFKRISIPNILEIQDRAFINGTSDCKLSAIDLTLRDAELSNIVPKVELSSFGLKNGIKIFLPNGVRKDLWRTKTNWAALEEAGIVEFEEGVIYTTFGSDGSDHEHLMDVPYISAEPQNCLCGETVNLSDITYLNSGNKLKFIHTSSFRFSKNLREINCPDVLSIGSLAFNTCHNLTAACLSNATYIGAITFGYTTNLETIDLASMKNIPANCFHSSGVRYVNCPNLTSIGTAAFRYSGRLSSLSCPKVTNIASYSFQSCSSLTEISLSSVNTVTKVGSASFNGITNIVSVYVPKDMLTSFQNDTSQGWQNFYPDKVIFKGV